MSLHDEGEHPHIHLMVYSTKDNEGFLTEKGIEAMRSELAHDIFRQDFANLYAEQNQSKAGLKEIAESAMQGLLLQMRSCICVNAAIEKDVLLLAQRLQNTAGKKQYGYLNADVKIIVDRIVDELAKQDTVAQAYAAWREIQNGILNTYQDKLPDPLPLSQQKEFKSIKNMVIKEALNIGNGAMTFESVGGEDGEADFIADEPPPDDTDHAPLEPTEDSRPHLDWSDAYKQARLCLFGDGDTPPDFEKAYDLFLREADGGNALAMHDLGRMFADGLGRDVYETVHTLYAESDQKNFPYASYGLAKMYRDGVGTIKNTAKADECFQKAFVGFVALEAQSHDDKLQYRIGQMLLTGTGTEEDVGKATAYFEKSARLGNSYAQYQLAKIFLADDTADLAKIQTAIVWLTKSAEQQNPYAQYTLSKLYLMVRDVVQDKAKALEYFTLSAAQGNEYAQFFINHMDDFHEPSVLLCATRLMHHLSNIFEEQALPPVAPHGMQIDRKQRKKMQRKKAAQGHAQDDNAQEQTMG